MKAMHFHDVLLTDWRRWFHIAWIFVLLVVMIACIWLAVHVWDMAALAGQQLDLVMVEVLVFTILVAAYGYRSASRSTRLTNSFEHIAIQTRDRDLITMFEEFRQLRRYMNDIKQAHDGVWTPTKSVHEVQNYYVGKPLGADADADATAKGGRRSVPPLPSDPCEDDIKGKTGNDVIKKVFNYYEATAIGVRMGALEEDVIRKWWRKTYILDWLDFKFYVQYIRENEKTPRAYCEYEALVTRWASDEEAGLL